MNLTCFNQPLSFHPPGDRGGAIWFSWPDQAERRQTCCPKWRLQLLREENEANGKEGWVIKQRPGQGGNKYSHHHHPCHVCLLFFLQDLQDLKIMWRRPFLSKSHATSGMKLLQGSRREQRSCSIANLLRTTALSITTLSKTHSTLFPFKHFFPDHCAFWFYTIPCVYVFRCWSCIPYCIKSTSDRHACHEYMKGNRGLWILA